jgi:hypothetical protein
MRWQDRVAQYQQHAAQCVEIASGLSDPDIQLTLLDMAFSWLTLAEQAERNPALDLIYETPELAGKLRPYTN